MREGFDKGSEEIDIIEMMTSSASGKLRYQTSDISGLELRSEYRQDEQTSESMFMSGINDNLAKIKNFNSRQI